MTTEERNEAIVAYIKDNPMKGYAEVGEVFDLDPSRISKIAIAGGSTCTEP